MSSLPETPTKHEVIEYYSGKGLLVEWHEPRRDPSLGTDAITRVAIRSDTAGFILEFGGPVNMKAVVVSCEDLINQ